MKASETINILENELHKIKDNNEKLNILKHFKSILRQDKITKLENSQGFNKEVFPKEYSILSNAVKELYDNDILIKDELLKWFDDKIDFYSSFNIKNYDTSKRKEWNGTKSEFAEFVNKEYLDHKGKYPSLSAASEQLYNQYKFPYYPDWTKQNCYDLVRKV